MGPPSSGFAAQSWILSCWSDPLLAWVTQKFSDFMCKETVQDLQLDNILHNYLLHTTDLPSQPTSPNPQLTTPKQSYGNWAIGFLQWTTCATCTLSTCQYLRPSKRLLLSVWCRFPSNCACQSLGLSHVFSTGPGFSHLTDCISNSKSYGFTANPIGQYGRVCMLTWTHVSISTSIHLQGRALLRCVYAPPLTG